MITAEIHSAYLCIKQRIFYADLTCSISLVIVEHFRTSINKKNATLLPSIRYTIRQKKIRYIPYYI